MRRSVGWKLNRANTMHNVIITCSKCGGSRSWYYDERVEAAALRRDPYAPSMPDCPRCGHNEQGAACEKRRQLHQAITTGDLRHVKVLLADIDVVRNIDAGPRTALYFAAEVGSAEMASLILKKGGKPTVTYPMAGNETPLHAAASHGHYDVALILLENGASACVKDASGKSPLDIAREADLACMVHLLSADTHEIRQLAEQRRQEVQQQRRDLGRCVMCGEEMRGLGRLLGMKSHLGCNTFLDSLLRKPLW